ncbi:MAG: cardiolipin synthase [Holophagae bacterium]
MTILIWLFIVAAVAAAVAAAGHALLWKRDPRAALGWIVVCLAVPVIGPLFYFVFGINRIRTRAQALPIPVSAPEDDTEAITSSTELPGEFSELAGIGNAVSRFALTSGNSVEILYDGEQAYPAMLEAIDSASSHVYLSTYIFQTNRSGLAFIDALARANERGVDVRVVVDGIGDHYSRPAASRLLARRGVNVQRFMPPRLIPPAIHINLRNHRKILVADGRVAFTGGMNIGDRHLADELENPDRVVDVHFRLRGPVVGQLQQIFLDTWAFMKRSPVDNAPSDDRAAGEARCRTLVDGPDEDLDKILNVLVAAVASAREQVAIMTPYFVPPRELVGALKAAALRGVDVAVVIPGFNNLPFVHWATRHMLWELLQRGVRIYAHPPPFVHSKLLMVDRHYVQIGSSNMDPRSLRLNFELQVEIYDRDFAAVIDAHFQDNLMRAHEITLGEVDARSLPVRLRDGLAWLLTPYL